MIDERRHVLLPPALRGSSAQQHHAQVGEQRQECAQRFSAVPEFTRGGFAAGDLEVSRHDVPVQRARVQAGLVTQSPGGRRSTVVVVNGDEAEPGRLLPALVIGPGASSRNSTGAFTPASAGSKCGTRNLCSFVSRGSTSCSAQCSRGCTLSTSFSMRRRPAIWAGCFRPRASSVNTLRAYADRARAAP